MSYKTIFDAAEDGYLAWWFPAFGLIFVFIGAVFVGLPALMQILLPWGLQGRARRVFSWLFLSCAIFWTLAAFATTYSDYRAAASALRDEKYNVVEGPASDYGALPPGGPQKAETFVVNGRRFTYYGYVVSAGFHQMRSQGGPIREGLRVRIAYSGADILRLEIGQ